MSENFIPPFDAATAQARVQRAEESWNSKDPEIVALAYSVDSRWRNRSEFFAGRDAIRVFLYRKWRKELHYRLRKELWAYTDNRISVRFEYEWQDAGSGKWFRTHGNELWEFNREGLITRRDMSANDVPIASIERRIGVSRRAGGER